MSDGTGQNGERRFTTLTGPAMAGLVITGLAVVGLTVFSFSQEAAPITSREMTPVTDTRPGMVSLSTDSTGGTNSVEGTVPVARPEPSASKPKVILDDDGEEIDLVARAAWFDGRRKKAAEEAAKAIRILKFGEDGQGDGYDPVREHGEYFVNWTKPDLTLVFTGQMNGYLEPCGCAGLVRMNGGLSRRFSFFGTLRERGWNPVGFDVGGQIRRFGRQEELKFQLATEALRRMGYGAITLGAGDLKLPSQELVSYVAPTEAKVPSLFVSANVAPFGFDAAFTALYRKLRINGITVGVTGVLGDSFLRELSDDNLVTRSAAEGLAEVLPGLAKCDPVIVLCHGTPEESVALAKQFPMIDVIVTAGGPAEPPAEAPERIVRDDGSVATLIEVGERGNAAVVLGFSATDLSHPAYQRILLDSRYEASSEIAALMRDYQATLKAMGFGKLERRPIPHPNSETMGRFAGSQSCQSCHPEVYEHWLTTKHATAMKTLTEVSVPPRDYDPECVCCHVVGWDPQKSFPWISGYESVEKTPEMAGVGCESCHGPGAAHNAAEAGTDPQRQVALREAMHLTPGDAEKKICIGCHDGDNSPDFDFRLYHPVIDHPILP
ncbi:MAG: multiheme c-type cytochrome [Planctomycetia bacterium]|nr:multiheme c-type cytochrome [Planctomycetia bacterium]